MTRSYAYTEEGRAARTARKSQTKTALLEAARALFAEKGYEGVSVTEIGRRAGVSHSLINAYFDGKAGLLYALVEEINAGQLPDAAQAAEGEGASLVRLRAVLQVWADADLVDPQVVRVLHAYSWTWSAETEARNRLARAEFYAPVARLIDEGRARGEFPPGLAAETLAESIFALFTWAIRDALFREQTPEALVEGLWPQVLQILGLHQAA